MKELIVALFAAGVGALFCFYGYKAMRVLFPLWGFVAGFWAGGELVASITNKGFLSTALGIMMGLVLGIVFAVLAYLYYAVAVIIFMGFVGYWLGSGLMKLIGFKGGVIATVVGLVLAVVFVVGSMMANVPGYLLLLLTALIGGALIVSSVLVVGNVADLSQLNHGAVELVSQQSWVWKTMWFGLSLFGYLTQLSQVESEQLAWEKEWNS